MTTSPPDGSLKEDLAEHQQEPLRSNEIVAAPTSQTHLEQLNQNSSGGFSRKSQRRRNKSTEVRGTWHIDGLKMKADGLRSENFSLPQNLLSNPSEEMSDELLKCLECDCTSFKPLENVRWLCELCSHTIVKHIHQANS